MDVNLVMKKTSCSDAGDVETGIKIATNESKSASLNANDKSNSTQADDKIDSDAKRPSVLGRISSHLLRKSEEDKTIYNSEEIKYGKYIIAWTMLSFRMVSALLVEFVIGFLAILTAKGEFQVLSTSVSVLYLFYLFSSSKSQNTIYCINSLSEFHLSRECKYIVCELLIVGITLPIILLITVIFDLVNIRLTTDFGCMGPHNLLFAAADLITIVASINFASRATELSTAVPLLVSFDFLTKFSTHILDSIEVSDHECGKVASAKLDFYYTYYDGHRAKPWCSIFSYSPQFVLPFAVGIVITGVVLAILSIGIN